MNIPYIKPIYRFKVPAIVSANLNLLLKKTSAWLPMAMSCAALLLLLGVLAAYGVPEKHAEDEGTAAHLFQLLMGGQLLIIGFFIARWLPEKPKQALAVLALRVGVALLPMALLYFFEH